jgi:hypothetical protein
VWVVREIVLKEIIKCDRGGLEKFITDVGDACKEYELDGLSIGYLE